MILSATADTHTYEYRLLQLVIPAEGLVVAGFARLIIRYRVTPRVSPAKQLTDFIAANPGPGIVYCPTRSGTERLAEQLAKATGRTVAAYHAGLDAEVRARVQRSEEHTSELQSLMRISYAVFCLKKKNNSITQY